MPIQVAAHGFEMTDGLRNSCIEESTDKLQPLALHNFGTRWALSLEAAEHVAHLTWTDGPFHGDVTVRSNDMYTSIHSCAKKAVEQIKKAHDKRYDHHQTQKAEKNLEPVDE